MVKVLDKISSISQSETAHPADESSLRRVKMRRNGLENLTTLGSLEGLPPVVGETNLVKSWIDFTSVKRFNTVSQEQDNHVPSAVSSTLFCREDTTRAIPLSYWASRIEASATCR
jgi:hypothetical protein